MKKFIVGIICPNVFLTDTTLFHYNVTKTCVCFTETGRGPSGSGMHEPLSDRGKRRKMRVRRSGRAFVTSFARFEELAAATAQLSEIAHVGRERDEKLYNANPAAMTWTVLRVARGGSC